MAVSILHRITGGALTVAGLAALTWWLLAVSGGDKAYEDFSGWAGHWAGLVVLIGLTWAYFQHLFSGIRHLVMDSGAGFEIESNKTGSILTIVAAVVATAAIWFYILGVRA